MDKYKFVIFGDSWDVYQVAFRELIENPRMVYIPTFRPNGILGSLQRLQFNPRVNHLVNIPGKSWWNALILRHIKEQQLCFLILEHWLRHESGLHLLPYLKKRYPQAKIICFTQDLIETIKDQYTRHPIDVDYIKRYADLFVCYDYTDARKYHIAYHPTVFSSIHIGDCQKVEAVYDLFFLGRDKGRLPMLIQICKEAQKRGLTCHFLLIEVPQVKRIKCEGIYYLDTPLTYQENLQNCTQSRCIIEILQREASSPTFRTWETIMLNKKLLTNNSSIQQYTDIYDQRYISVFHTIDDIDWSFIANKSEVFPQNENPYQEVVRPKALVRFIEKQLNIQIDQ